MSAPASVRGVKLLADIEEEGMTYKLWDNAGFLIASIRFHSRTSEAVMVEYMEKIAKAVGAATYSPVAIEEDA